MIPHIPTVVAALDLSGSSGRRILAGILAYINAGHAINLKLLTKPEDLKPTDILWAKSNHIDGFVAFVTPTTASEFARSNVPLVTFDFVPPELYKRQRNITLLIEDNEIIGKAGADYFLSLGRFACFAFVPDSKSRGWSRLRQRAFVKRLREKGQITTFYKGNDTTLESWLLRLPKPAAIMAPYDFLAKDILDACRRLKIAVPEQVAVLGVDNDELLCDYSYPTLSSIGYDQEQFGTLAMETIDKMMRRNSGRRKLTILRGMKVFERGSTRPLPSSSHLVERALSFIERHSLDGISAKDVVAHLGVSHRLANLRFSKATGSTIHREIEARKLKSVLRLLTTTDMPIQKISTLSGYTNPQRLKYVFKLRYGLSMSEYRKTKG